MALKSLSLLAVSKMSNITKKFTKLNQKTMKSEIILKELYVSHTEPIILCLVKHQEYLFEKCQDLQINRQQG